MNYYNVVILDATRDYDADYTYQSNREIPIGTIVLVPFGVSNRKEAAIVVSSAMSTTQGYKIKEISDVLDWRMTLANLALVYEVCEYYMLNPASVLRLYFQDFKRKTKTIKEVKTYRFAKTREELLDYITTLNSNATQIPAFIMENIGGDEVFVKTANITKKNFNRLLSDGIIEEYKVNSQVKELHTLTESQSKIFEEIRNSEEDLHMLIGKNASGKTEIFFHLCKHYAGVKLIMVPELFQIPQLELRARAFFGDRVAVIHSKVTNAKRYEIEKKLLKGELDLIIGTPIALFLNVDYSLIILDESHEDSYKLFAPCIDVRKVCMMLSNISHAKVLFASATPSLDYYVKPEINKHILSQRYVENIVSTIRLIDMREELISGNKSYISHELDQNIRKTLSEGKQVLILMNKRGKHSFVSCRECGFVYTCDHCELPYLHMGSNKLECKLCAKKIDMDVTCPGCSSKYIKYFGGGIMKLEEELNKTYKDVRILRVESSMLKNEKMINKVYSDIRAGLYDIIIGTHIIAKALDIKNVGLSAVVMADSLLNVSEYRAYEKAFQIMYQLSGRVSRFESGKTIIQTYNPDNYIFKHLLADDFFSFADEELSVRMDTQYPPYVNHILLKAYLEEDSEAALDEFVLELRRQKINYKSIYQPILFKKNGYYVYNILFVSDDVIELKSKLTEIFNKKMKFRYRLEVDPLYLMY